MSSPIRIRNIKRYTNRHGKEALYYRLPDRPLVRLRGPIGSPELWEDYLAAAKTPQAKTVRKLGKGAGTLAWLIGRYKTSVHWKA